MIPNIGSVYRAKANLTFDKVTINHGDFAIYVGEQIFQSTIVITLLSRGGMWKYTVNKTSGTCLDLLAFCFSMWFEEIR